MTAFEKHIKIRTAAKCSLELQTSEHDPRNYCVRWHVQYTVFSIQNAECYLKVEGIEGGMELKAASLAHGNVMGRSLTP